MPSGTLDHNRQTHRRHVSPSTRRRGADLRQQIDEMQVDGVTIFATPQQNMIAAKTMLDAIIPQVQDVAATPALAGVQRVLSATAIQAANAEWGENQQPAVGLPPRPLATGQHDQDPQGSKQHRAP
jgi:hypothetical protein